MWGLEGLAEDVIASAKKAVELTAMGKGWYYGYS